MPHESQDEKRSQKGKPTLKNNFLKRQVLPFCLKCTGNNCLLLCKTSL
jgi:hypothetical protein